MSGERIVILGGGAWGTALAQAQALAGRDVVLWARDPKTVRCIREERRNPDHLPGVVLAPGIAAETAMAKALEGAGCVLLATPAQSVAAMLEALAPHLAQSASLVLCAKGIDRASGRFLAEIAEAQLGAGHGVAVLSGPSFAADVARGLPTAVTVAATDDALAARLAALLSGPTLRCYSTDDRIGVEIGGALKNVLALAVGAASGAGLGASAQAALAARGFAELRRIGAAYGARPETMMGLSGLGDLMLTCSSAQSRNFSYGLALGRGESVAGLPLAEGVATAGVAVTMAAAHDVEAPIIVAVDAILAGRITIDGAVAALMRRPLRPEDN